MRVVAHGPVEELGGAAGPRPLLQEHHLVHVVAREAVGGGDEHPVDLAALDGVAQAVEPRAGQHRAAVAVVAEHVRRVEAPALGGMRVRHGRSAARAAAQWSGARPGGWSRHGRRSLPAWDISGRIGGSGASAGAGGSSPTAGGAGRPGPSAAGRLPSARRCAGRARCVAADRRMLSSPVSDLAGELGRTAAPEPMARPRPAQLQLSRARQAELVICD